MINITLDDLIKILDLRAYISLFEKTDNNNTICIFSGYAYNSLEIVSRRRDFKIIGVNYTISGACFLIAKEEG